MHVHIVFIHGAQALIEQIEQIVVHRPGGIGLDFPEEKIGIVFLVLATNSRCASICSGIENASSVAIRR